MSLLFCDVCGIGEYIDHVCEACWCFESDYCYLALTNHHINVSFCHPFFTSVLSTCQGI